MKRTFSILLAHELRDIILGPRFTVVFLISALLLIASTIIGAAEYHRGHERLASASRSVDEEIAEAEHWFSVSIKVHKRPDPLSVFVTGVMFDLGERSEIGYGGSQEPYGSVYSSDVLFAFYRFLDFSFVFQMVVSLLAILFTYDRISGERASGTLRIVMSNAIPRVHVMTAKLAGALIGLTTPILIVVGVCVLLVIQLDVPVSPSDAARLGVLVAVSIVYLSFFIAIGLFVSSLTKESSTSFLVLLILWAGFALIVPRAATEVAGQIVRPTTLAQLQSEHMRFVSIRYSQMRDEMNTFFEQMRNATEMMSESERMAYYREHQDAHEKQLSDAQRRMTDDIARNHDLLTEARRVTVRQRERIAALLARISPVGSYRLASMSLAGTDLASKDAFEDALRDYESTYRQFILREGGGTRPPSGNGSERVRLDPSEMPRFVHPIVVSEDAIRSAMPDAALLVLYTILAIAGAFIAFLRYDVR